MPDGEELWFYARWRLAEGEPAQMSLRAGLAGPLPSPDLAGATVRTHLDSGALVTELRAGDRCLRREERRLEAGGGRLQVLQTREGGEQFDARYRRSDVKQVLLYRRDLKMRKGKIAAQCAHASMAVFFRRDDGPIDRLSAALDGPMALWSKGRFAKVVLSVDDEAALLEAHRLAQQAGLPTAIITDAGKTEFHGVPTRTTVAIGPAELGEIDQISGPAGAVRTKLA